MRVLQCTICSAPLCTICIAPALHYLFCKFCNLCPTLVANAYAQGPETSVCARNFFARTTMVHVMSCNPVFGGLVCLHASKSIYVCEFGLASMLVSSHRDMYVCMLVLAPAWVAWCLGRSPVFLSPPGRRGISQNCGTRRGRASR